WFWVKQGYSIQVKAPALQSLRYWSHCLKGQWRRTFERRHDNLLHLLDYYDPLARCFTFRDFQIAPTLEEYERLLGLPLEGLAQYFHQDRLPSWATIAMLLRVSEGEMLRAKKKPKRIYLEDRLLRLREKDNWPAIIDIFGLLLYGILLFPQLWKSILAKTYYTLHHCSQQGEGNLRCNTSLLYLWLTSHLFHCKNKTKCPIEDFKWSWIKKCPKNAGPNN
ncbi:hypothetical protein CR513_46852, partial [Mucuna pruriens]